MYHQKKEASQIYGAVLPECLTSPEMKESKTYNTYLGYATGEVPPKVARKFKKASPSKKESELVPGDEEPVKKGKRLKTPAKKSASKPATSIVIREPPVETKSKRKEKEKEVRKKSLRDFHKTHPSGSGTITETLPSVKKITPTVTSEGTGDKLGVPDVTNDDSSESESESWGNDEDDSNNEQELSDESSKQENESEEQELDSEQDEESNDDQEEEEFDQENESEDDELLKNKLVKDVHVVKLYDPKKTEVPVTISSRSSDLASKFLNFSDIPQTNAEIVSPLDVPVHHEVPRTQAPTLLTIPISVIPESSLVFTNIPQSSHTFTPTPIQATPTPPPIIETINPLSNLHDFSSVFQFNDRIIALEKEVVDLKRDPLHTQARIKEQVKDQLPQILPQEVSNFAPPMIEKLIKESRDEVTLEKVSSQPQSTYEAASTLTEFELKKILLDKMEKNKDKDEDPSAGSDRGLKKRKTSKDVEPTTGPKKKDSTSGSSKGTKSQPKSTRKSVQSEEPVFEVADSDMPQDQAGNLGDNENEPRHETVCKNVGKTTKEGPTQTWLMNLAASNPTDKSLKDFDELMSTPIDFSSFVLNGLKIENLTQEILLGPAFRLLKGTRSNYSELEYNFEELPFEFFINNDLKYLQGGISTMTYTTSTAKTKAAKYDLPGIGDIVLNIWSHVKVAYDKYLEEIVVRRANNVLYRFKEGIRRCWTLPIEPKDMVHQKSGYSKASQRSLTRS
ncbi:hypothetical protein Tco_0374899 [Tanacetum coccineum]